MIAFSIVNYQDDEGASALAARLLAEFSSSVVFIHSNAPSDLRSKERLHHAQGAANLGYGRGHNLNIEAARSSGFEFDALFICNTDLDLQIDDAEALRERLRSWRDRPAFIATNKADGSPNVGYFLPYFSLGRPVPGARPYAAGNFFGITRALLPTARFDPEFFLYFEEVDLQIRSKVDLLVAPELRIAHRALKLLDRSNVTAARHAPASRIIIARKLHGQVGVWLARAQNLALGVLKRP